MASRPSDSIRDRRIFPREGGKCRGSRMKSRLFSCKKMPRQAFELSVLGWNVNTHIAFMDIRGNARLTKCVIAGEYLCMSWSLNLKLFLFPAFYFKRKERSRPATLKPPRVSNRLSEDLSVKSGRSLITYLFTPQMRESERKS